jgi:flagellar secretion chaperone FliS
MQTAAPGQIVLMLFEGAIRFLERAEGGFVIDDPAEANQTIHNNIQRTQEILHELNMALDVQSGGELAQTLRSLYEYMDRRLLESNLRKQTEGIVESRRHLTTLRDAWAQMLQGESPRPSLPQSAMATA